MTLTDIQILELLRKAKNNDAIAAGEKLQNEHKVHVTGEGYEGLVRQVQGFESTNDFNIRKQISKPATISIVSIIIDNLNRWVNAQGTIKKINLNDQKKEEAFNDVLDQVWNDKSFDDFIKTFYKEAIYTDFNGVVLVTKPKIIAPGLVEKEGVLRLHEGSLMPYIIFIANNDVHDFLLSGDKVEYLIIKLDDKNKIFRVIDDVRDIIIDYTNDAITVTSEVPNEIGYVPAIKISNLNERLLKSQVKTSPIAHIIPALDRYFSSDADLRMQFIKHAYPKLIIVARDCVMCHGTGTVYDHDTKVKCNTCDGLGKEIPINRDGVIGIPQFLTTGDTAYPGSPASYVNPDVDSLRLCIEDLDKQRKDLLYAGTGDKGLISDSIREETATATMASSRSLEDRIAEIIGMVENFETFIKKAIKDLHKDFTNIKDYSITVRYGRRLTIKGETELLDEIKQSKTANMPSSYIFALQKDLIHSKYKNNAEELDRQLILADVEPFCGYSIDELMKFSAQIDQNDLKLKVNFDSLVDQFEADNVITEFAKSATYKKRIQLIKEKLLSYAVVQRSESDDTVYAGQTLEGSTTVATGIKGNNAPIPGANGTEKQGAKSPGFK